LQLRQKRLSLSTSLDESPFKSDRQNEPREARDSFSTHCTCHRAQSSATNLYPSSGRLMWQGEQRRNSSAIGRWYRRILWYRSNTLWRPDFSNSLEKPLALCTWLLSCFHGDVVNSERDASIRAMRIEFSQTLESGWYRSPLIWAPESRHATQAICRGADTKVSSILSSNCSGTFTSGLIAKGWEGR